MRDMAEQDKLPSAYLQEIANNLNTGDVHKAESLVKEALSLYSSDRNLLIIANDVFRACNDLDAALKSAKELIEHHPSYIDGYCRAAQELTKMNRLKEAVDLISVGLEKFPEDLWTLYTAMTIYLNNENYQLVCEYGNKLLSVHPTFILFYAPYVESLYRLNLNDKAEEVIDIVFSRFPTEIMAIRLKLDLMLRKRQNREYRSWLYDLALRMPEYSNEFVTRIHRFELLTTCQSVLPRNEKQCDVCCIASDEAPYIAEFVHHYLYLGFANIFIGINNSSDQTLEILNKIVARHPNVHVLDVNSTQSVFYQNGCYRKLFSHSRCISTAKYCLFVDVDEFWVADPFPKSIGQFLENRLPFDVYSFHWIMCSGESFFAPPLSAVKTYSWSPHLKSMCCYDSHILDFTPHSPFLEALDTLSIIRGNRPNKYLRLFPASILVLETAEDYAGSSFSMSGLAWIFHRYLRSELEYSFKVFKKRATSVDDDYFKTNRWGYIIPDFNPEIDQYMNKILPAAEIHRYHESLEVFLRENSLNDMIEVSRSVINEQQICERIASIPPEIMKRDASLIRTLFCGTRFQDGAVGD